MTESFKGQKAAQEAEELDLRNGGYPEKFIRGMRTVKGKLIHVRVVAVCLSVYLIILMPPPSNLVLTGILVLFALMFRNYPMYTRFTTGSNPSLSGRKLYEEQLQYLRRGALVAVAYLIAAGALIATVLTCYAAKVAAERGERGVYSELEWSAHARQTEFGQKLEMAVLILFFIAIGLIVASCLRWINLISCRSQLRNHRVNEAGLQQEDDVQSSSSLGATSSGITTSPPKTPVSQFGEWDGSEVPDVKGVHKTFAQRRKVGLWILAFVPVILVIGAIVVLSTTATEVKKQAEAEDEADSGVRVIPDSPGRVAPPAGVCPILKTLLVGQGTGEETISGGGGDETKAYWTESSYDQSTGRFCVDKTQHASLVMHDGSVVALRPSIEFVIVPFDRNGWVQFVSEHPTDEGVIVIKALCSQGVSVRTSQGRDLVEMANEGVYKASYFMDACAVALPSDSPSQQPPAPVAAEPAQPQVSAAQDASSEPPAPNASSSVSPSNITPSSAQDPTESKRLNTEGLRTLSGANPDFASARNDFERAFQLDSTNVEALNNLGYVYGRLGDYSTAESTLLKVLDMSPTRQSAQGNLGDVQAELGKTQEAADHFCQYIRGFHSLEHGKSTLSRVFKDANSNVKAAVDMALANCN